jgi:hypothetical protein
MAAARKPQSIQGFQQDQASQDQYMSDGDVDEYVSKASDEVLMCRERGRHLWPSVRKVGVHFTGVTTEGLLVRQLRCECCGLAERREFWETVGRGSNLRYRPVDATTVYLTGDSGEKYLVPSGRGRMTSKMVRGTLVSKALEGQTLTSVKAAARQSGKRA